MDASNHSDDNKDENGVALCASCDRCRSRKTKCDGQRPCSNCTSKYLKRHKLNSIDGIDVAEFECIYSPAKRRGPIPGRTSTTAGGTTRKAGDMENNNGMMMNNNNSSGMGGGPDWTMSMMGTTGGGGGGGGVGTFNNTAAVTGAGPSGMLDAASMQQQLTFLQLQAQQQQIRDNNDNFDNVDMEPNARRVKREGGGGGGTANVGIPRTITTHTHLLDRSDPEGSRLRAYYCLSVDELFRLPPTPTDEEYCVRLNVPGMMTPQLIPGAHLAALSAARFAEVALGALVHDEVSLAMELCNAVVHCLRESVQAPVQLPVMFDVAKAYFLLGVFRALRGDMLRYFKYRRVCLTFLAKLESGSNTISLLAALSYLDSWAYMIYNANEKALPSVDDIPPVAGSAGPSTYANETEAKYDVKMDVGSIASDPKNKNWIQGAPPVYLNNEAPLESRALDALACAVRSCCDQANSRFAAIAKEANPGVVSSIPPELISTPTSTIVMSHENELCSRNIVLSAYTLMQQHEAQKKGKHKNEGQHMVISAMDAFLENHDEEGNGGFTDSQIQSLLSVCNTAVENPFLLHHAGPTYHMVTNAAVLLCHLLNGMYMMKQEGQSGRMEDTMFEEVVDTLMSVRKLLTIHRRKLPVKLRCHGIPRPSLDGPPEGQPFIDLGETVLCACRGCQGFVLMACSPCVAAERAQKATLRMEQDMMLELDEVELGRELLDLGAEFDLDDDALLGMISNLISN